MDDINVMVRTILEKNRGITAYEISKKISKCSGHNGVSREDISKVLQRLKRMSLATNSGSIWTIL